MTAIAHYREADGKTQTLQEHLESVAELACGHAAKIGLGETGRLLGLLHDLGKFSDEFQAYIKSSVGLLNPDEDEEFVDASGLRGKVDHSTAGAQWIWNHFSEENENRRLIVGQVIALCIASHHSGLIDCLTCDSTSTGEDGFSRRMAKSTTRTHIQEVIHRAASILSLSMQITGSKNPENEIIAKFKAIAQADASYGEIVIRQKVGLLVRFLFSCLVDADRIDSADFERPHKKKIRRKGQYIQWSKLTDRLEDYLTGLAASSTSSIDSIRKRVSDQCLAAASRPKGIYTLTVPTGGGKTLASLRFAVNHAKQKDLDRIIFIIPFTTIIDQNAQKVRDILEMGESEANEKIVLEHHSNLTPEAQTWKEKLLAENWDAPVIFTTMVQFLEVLFAGGTASVRRMHQLSNSVLIFDEIQTLPVNCVHIFNNAINFLNEHCESTVVLCTATQPLLNEVDPSLGSIHLSPNAELVSDVKLLFSELKRTSVVNQRKPRGWRHDEIAELAMQEAKEAGSCLVIVNTKKSAEQLYRICADGCSAEGIQLFHLSTHMCPAHRKKVLEDMRERLSNGESVVCMSTQLIEAGVDIDFASVIRFSAGLDSIAQAAGRCNRHGKRDIGNVHIVNPVDESLEMLQDIALGRLHGERVLSEFTENPADFDNDILSPGAIRRYFNYYFFDRASEMTYPLSAKVLGHDDTLLNLLSANSLVSQEARRKTGQSPKIYLRQSFMAAPICQRKLSPQLI